MSPLTLVQLTPDREAMAQWAARLNLLRRTNNGRHVDDNGHIWHALLKAAFGDLAPKPFVDRHALRRNELLGYVSADRDQLISAAAGRDAMIARAIGLDQLRANDLPTTWQSGRRLSFEVRARPVVRSRTDARSGAADEVDFAPFRARQDASISREQAYAEWLAREMARADAAKLIRVNMRAFSRSCVMRKTQGSNRSPIGIEGPDAWFVGELEVADPVGFAALLARGIGRHRAFGFGCLLVAKPGVLD